MPPRSRQQDCTTVEQRADHGQHCRPVVQNPGLRNIQPDDSPLVFTTLWSNYPNSKPYVDKSGNPPKGYENQCAIKVSQALQLSGVDMASFKGATASVAGKRLVIRAEELATWLKKRKIPGVGSPLNITGADWQDKAKNKKGIIYFANYWKREGEKSPSGDHIDLWNGSRLTASGFEGTVVTLLRFGLGVSSGPGFSDLGKSTEILLWEM
jgi:hypothetical protein